MAAARWRPFSSLQISLESDEELETFLEENADRVICLEVYSEVFGNCLAIRNTLRKCKLDNGNNIALAKAPADNIAYLERFRDRSEPIFLFIRNHKPTRVAIGCNTIELVRHMKEEIAARAGELQAAADAEYDVTDEDLVFNSARTYVK